MSTNKNTHKIGANLPSPRITSKRNLSNSSLSPNQNGKKSKFFVSPNKFAVLANNCENSDVSTPSICSKGDSTISPHAVQDNDPPAPPIYIKNIANYSAFNSTLTSITGPNALTCKSSASHLIVQPSGRNSFNKIVSHLNETDASFHSFSPRFRRPYRVVIRNLHPSTLDTDISSSLDELGHQVKHIYNAKDKNKRPLPLFFVEIYSDEKNEDIHNIKSLLNTKVVIEKPHKKSYSRPQCHNCQEFGHTQNYCNHASRCVKCGAEHHTDECTKNPKSPAKCALCSGDHTANFRGCPVFKRAQKKNKKTFKITSSQSSSVKPSFQSEILR